VKTNENTPLLIAVYDPSNRRADTTSYWQWSNVPLDPTWDFVADQVDRGWPGRVEVSGREASWSGLVALRNNGCWIYRLYAAGKDHFGRDGRYFFILVHLGASEDIVSCQVAGLFNYFDGERSLPLTTKPLEDGIPEAVPDQIFLTIMKMLEGGHEAGHWGVDQSGGIICFKKEDPIEDLDQSSTRHPSGMKSHARWRTKRRHVIFSIGLAIASVVVLLFWWLHRSHNNEKPVPTGAAPTPIPQTTAVQQRQGQAVSNLQIDNDSVRDHKQKPSGGQSGEKSPE
jgi:hypothetical protein